MNEAIIYIWVKIVAIIVLWEVWKYLAWELINWWVEKQVNKRK
jgi:hypothetical protein